MKRGRKSTACGHCGRKLKDDPIIRAAAQRYGILPAALHNKTRQGPRGSLARYISEYLLRKEGHTWCAIGAAVCRSDDAARTGYKRIERIMKINTTGVLLESVHQPTFLVQRLVHQIKRSAVSLRNEDVKHGKS